MAIKVEKRVVCDLGEKHGGPITNWRLTTDRESKVFDLCSSCAKPLRRLWDRGGEARQAPARMRVLEMSEIEALKREDAPHQ